MSDEMIRMMKKNGGVIMVNFGSAFLDSNVGRHNDSLRTELAQQLIVQGIKEGSEEARVFAEDFGKKHPTLYSDVQKVADHIDHIVQLAGIDHVGFGSDYDGVGDSLPTGLKDVSDYPNLIKVLLQRGYRSKDIKKMCGANLFRVWNKVLKNAS
jgi:membrane dipeptidase